MKNKRKREAYTKHADHGKCEKCSTKTNWHIIITLVNDKVINGWLCPVCCMNRGKDD